MKPHIFFLFFCLGCGSVPIEPELESNQATEPLLILPSEFQGVKFTEAKKSSLTGTSLQRFYPNNSEVQQFEYENQYILGYLIKYESPIEARLQHDAAIALMEGPNLESDGYNPFYVMEGRKPNLFLFAGNAAVYLTIDPRNDNQATILAKAQMVASIIFDLNQANVPPYYVDVVLKQYEPGRSTILTAGTTVPLQVTLDYILASPDQGQIVFDIIQEKPLIQKQVSVSVSKGMGTVTFADTLQLSSDIPNEGTTVTVTATLLPPYIGSRLPSIIRGHIIEKIPQDQYRITARSQLTYQVH